MFEKTCARFPYTLSASVCTAHLGNLEPFWGLESVAIVVLVVGERNISRKNNNIILRL